MADGSTQVQQLLSQLRSNLTTHALPAHKQQSLLEQLKVLGRNSAYSDAIFATTGIETLSKYGFDQENLDVSREALRCLANAMLLSETARQIFLDLGYANKAATRLQNDNRDDEFLLSRIIFLLTYKTNVDLKEMVRGQGVAKSICRNIKVHAQRYSGASKDTHPMDEMALIESLKLLFNITAHEPELAEEFTDCVPDQLTILTHIKLPSPPLQPPLSHVINALMNMEIPKDSISTTEATARMTSILEKSITTYPESELDTNAMPLVALLRKSYAAATDPVQAFLKENLLPNDEARNQPLGKDDTLPSRLLRLSASPALMGLRDNISTLLFELSDSDPATFIRNIGYGHAAGFLASHSIDVPPAAMGGSAGSADTGDADAADFNPVTGQRRAAEPVDVGPEMTDEEKEQEAERLFVLFERLRATGVVDVENPVRRYQDEGRFEEIE